MGVAGSAIEVGVTKGRWSRFPNWAATLKRVPPNPANECQGSLLKITPSPSPPGINISPPSPSAPLLPSSTTPLRSSRTAYEVFGPLLLFAALRTGRYSVRTNRRFDILLFTHTHTHTHPIKGLDLLSLFSLFSLSRDLHLLLSFSFRVSDCLPSGQTSDKGFLLIKDNLPFFPFS